MIPSIKGVALQLAAEGVRRVMQSGLIREADLPQRLTPGDLKIFNGDILPGLWYPIETCGRLIEIAAEADGGGDQAYLEKVGSRVAKTFFSTSVYNPFVIAGEKAGSRSGKVLISMTQIALNFTKWTYEPNGGEAGGFTIEITEAAAFPDVLRFISLGFIKYLAERVNGVPAIVTSLRPTPDLIVIKGELVRTSSDDGLPGSS
jgi:hypothetical protein